MSETDVAIWLAVAAVLVAGNLYTKHRQRVRSRKQRYDPAEWTGKGIEVTSLRPKIEQVRRDHLAARQPARGRCFHRALLNWARQAVARLPYFRDKESEDHARTHSP